MAYHFQFRLQKLLDLRSRDRDSASVRLHKLEHEHRSLESQSRNLHTELADLNSELSADTEIDVRDLLDVDRLREVLASKIDQAMEKLEALTPRVAAAREELLKAEKDFQVLAKLRERQLRDWRKTVAKQEQTEVDEAASRISRQPHSIHQSQSRFH